MAESANTDVRRQIDGSHAHLLKGVEEHSRGPRGADDELDAMELGTLKMKLKSDLEED